MGGNTTIQTKSGESVSAERIPLKEIGRKEFVEKFQDFLLNMNKLFHSRYQYYIWSDESEIKNAGIFNGSTSFIMSDNYSDEEIIKYKPTAGDLDVAVPREAGKDIYNFLESIEGTSYAELTDGIKYIGNNANNENKLGNTIICIAKAKFGEITVQAQLDLELSEMESGKQTDWSAFAHSSSFEDAKAGVKGVANKHFWRALVGSIKQLDSGFVVATPSSTIDKLKLKGKQPSKIRLLNFGVDSGVGGGYELMMQDGKPLQIDGKDVYREKKPQEKTYDKNLTNLMKKVFGVSKFNPKDLHSFIKTLELANKYLDTKTKQIALDRFLAILFCNDGGQCQEIEPNPNEDISLKVSMYEMAAKKLKLKPTKDLEKIANVYREKKFGITESFRTLLESYKDK
jgi:hypothetical protein